MRTESLCRLMRDKNQIVIHLLYSVYIKKEYRYWWKTQEDYGSPPEKIRYQDPWHHFNTKGAGALVQWLKPVTERWRSRHQTVRTRISNSASGGQCHLIHLIILMRFSWSRQFRLHVHKCGIFHFNTKGRYMEYLPIRRYVSPTVNIGSQSES